MPRVIGIDPGTVSIDLCGLDNGRVFMDHTLPTSDAFADPAKFLALLDAAGQVDLIAGPSGYGLPCITGRDLTETDLRLAYLAAEGESGGIGGLGALMRALARSHLPVVFTPGVIHLTSVPEHRKINRVDMGTADKLCAVVLAAVEQVKRRRSSVDETAFILLELGGAFTSAIAVDGGRVVDGIGGSAGPLGLRGSGALDGEVAFLAGTVSKAMIFHGGAAAVARASNIDAFTLTQSRSPEARLAWDAYLESAAKAVLSLRISAPRATDVILSGRVAAEPGVGSEIGRRLEDVLKISVHILRGFTTTAKHAAQGAALLADGLAGGSTAPIVDRLGIPDARGTALDYLYIISAEQARKRLGIA